jgi:hypothetical protein
MRWICLLTVLLLSLPAPARAGHTPPKLFLRIHVQTAGEGLPATQAITIALPPNGEQIQIRALPEVSENNLIGAEQDTTGRVHLQFNHQGEVNLSAVTGENEGRILVVMLNGYIVYAPVIDQQITNGELILPHSLTPQIMQLLQDIALKNVKKANKT